MVTQITQTGFFIDVLEKERKKKHSVYKTEDFHGNTILYKASRRANTARRYTRQSLPSVPIFPPEGFSLGRPDHPGRAAVAAGAAGAGRRSEQPPVAAVHVRLHVPKVTSERHSLEHHPATGIHVHAHSKPGVRCVCAGEKQNGDRCISYAHPQPQSSIGCATRFTACSFV